MLGIIAASIIALAANPSNPATLPIQVGKCCGVSGAIVIQGLSGPQDYFRKTGGSGQNTIGEGPVPVYNIADCRSYYAKVKMGDGSVRVVRMQPAGALGHCSFAFSGPVTPPFQLFIGFGGEKHGWQIGREHLSQADTHELKRIGFTFKKIDIEDKLSKTASADDWTL